MKPVVQRAAGRDGALSAALAAVLELDLADTPAGPGGSAALDAWQAWLAARNLQLVEARAPLGAGFWIAVHEDRAVVMFGSPPDVVWDPAAGWGQGRDRSDEPAPDAVYVLATLDPAVGDPRAGLPTAEPGAGTVRAIYVTAASEAPAQALDEAEAVPGRGLAGDRYFAGTGHFSRPGKTGQDLTLIAVEALAELAAETGIALDAGAARRNVLTEGIDLNALVGRRFTVGEVECVGRRWCEPCAHLQRLTTPGVLRGLIHRGGLRADVVSAGRIRVGDPVRAAG